MMSSLAMAATAGAHAPDEREEDEMSSDCTPIQESLISKTSNQDMDMDGLEELGKHLEDLINKKANKEDPEDEEILFGGSQQFF